MRDRITTLISSCTDPFAQEIYYHKYCWTTYITRNLYNDDYYNEPPSSTSKDDIQKMFLDHVKDVIIDRNEPRTLQGLLEDYNSLSEKFGSKNTLSQKSTSHLKTLLETKFGTQIGFHERFHRNRSTIVYSAVEGGSFIECAINSWGIEDDQFINNFARFLKTKLKDQTTMTWPRFSIELENTSQPATELRKLLTWLRNPNESNFEEECEKPEIAMLGDLLLSFVTGKRTLYQVCIYILYPILLIIFLRILICVFFFFM